MQRASTLAVVLSLALVACGPEDSDVGSESSYSTEVVLPPLSTERGLFAHMFIAETDNPGYASYVESETYLALFAMKAVVHNRLELDPGLFAAPGATSYADIVTAPGQWHGFSRGAAGEVVIEASVLDRIHDIVRVANTGAPGAFHRYLTNVLYVAGAGVSDPFAGIEHIDGQPVRGGAYGWRTLGSSHPGGSFVAIPADLDGQVAGTQFYTLDP